MQSPPPPPRRGALLPGLLLLLFGAWLLARNLGWAVPGLAQLWPVVLVVGGLAFLAQYVAGGRRQEGLVFSGVMLLLNGALFLAITLGPLQWGDLGRLWPVFVLTSGLAFLAQWLAQPRERGLLFPALLGLGVGGVALLFTLRLLSPALVELAALWWPAGLIALGLLLLLSYLRFPGARA